MKLKKLKKSWNAWGKRDPLWAIVAFSDKKGGKWDIENFFRTGRKEIADVMEYIDSLKININKGNALDFGCGIGRLSQALAEIFKAVNGIDISPSMIKLAQKHNRFIDRCKYFLNDKDNLGIFRELLKS